MQLTEQNIEYIQNNLSFYAITDLTLKEDFLDHICCYIENSNHTDFETAYSEAINNFGGYATMQLQQQEQNQKQLIKSFINRKRNVYLTCAFNSIILMIGFLFFMFEWPYSGVLLLIGFGQLILITIPYILFDSYKRQSQKILLLNR
jgi:membrane-bound ClpP family serine protease